MLHSNIFSTILAVINLLTFIKLYLITISKTRPLQKYARTTKIIESQMPNLPKIKPFILLIDDKLVSDMKILYAIILLYVPLSLFWSLFDQQVKNLNFKYLKIFLVATILYIIIHISISRYFS